VPSGEVWAGNPARKTRDLKPEEKQYLETLPAYYVELSKEHADIVSLMGAKIAAQSS
jgi:carbonic anhydrase/acetyltransferase-like protein (isoleucine patch superfamily)